jgi:hypothetical protein
MVNAPDGLANHPSVAVTKPPSGSTSYPPNEKLHLVSPV